MGSLLLLSLPLLLAAPGPAGGSARRRQTEGWRRPSPSPSPPAPSGASVPFWVRLSPELVAVAPGHSVLLNCSTSCPPPTSFGLYTRLQRGHKFAGPGWVSYELVNVTAWSSIVRCYVTCRGETRQATARINAYQRPRSVILEPPVLTAGRYTLRCHVTQVFPVGFLVVTLRHGGRTLYSESLERFKGLDPANVTLTHAFRARPRDLWQPVSCHARLNLDGLLVRSSSAPVNLTAPDWNPESKALASTFVAALLGILLAMGVASLRRCLAMQSAA